MQDIVFKATFGDEVKEVELLFDMLVHRIEHHYH